MLSAKRGLPTQERVLTGILQEPRVLYWFSFSPSPFLSFPSALSYDCLWVSPRGYRDKGELSAGQKKPGRADPQHRDCPLQKDPAVPELPGLARLHMQSPKPEDERDLPAAPLGITSFCWSTSRDANSHH